MKKNLKNKKIIGAIISLGLFLYYVVTWGFMVYAIGSNRFLESIKSKLRRRKKEQIEQNLEYDELKEECEVKHWLNRVNIEEIILISKDNLKLYGRKMMKKKYSYKWVIAVHRYRVNGDIMNRYALRYYNRGYNVIIPDLRAHRNSEGKYIGMGWLDKDDIKLWIKHIINIDREAEIVLHGVSMGAATVMMLSGDKLPDNVKVIVEDCGFTSVYDIFRSESRARFKIAHYPMLLLGSLICKLRIGYSWFEASAIKQLKKNKDIPMLFIHGDKDTFVPFYMLDKLYNAAVCDKEKVVIAGAGHAEAVRTAGNYYWKCVFSFINKYIN